MFAYVVMSHRDPDLVGRLIERLRESSPEAIIVLRHDRSICPPPSPLPDGVHLGDDSPLLWGHWSLPAAIMRELAWVVDNTEATHAVVISGQDYPVRPLAEWERSVEHLDALMEADRLEFKAHWGRRPSEGDEAMIRYSYRWFKIPGSERWSCESRFARIANKLAVKAFGYVRPVAYFRTLARGRGTLIGIRGPWKLPTYKGDTWMLLSRRAINTVLAQDLTSFRRALNPAEAAIHSGVMSNPDLNVEFELLSYSRWSGGSHPELITRDDLDAIRDSGRPFTRKVELSPLLDELDRLSAE